MNINPSTEPTSFPRRPTFALNTKPSPQNTYCLSVVVIVVVVVRRCSLYSSVPVSRLPWVVAYLPTEPLLKPTRALVPPVGLRISV
jgi:hypothetical protein